MNPQNHSSERLESLLHALFDQGLSPEQGRELDELLRADPAARRTYMQFADLQANLERHLVSRHGGSTGDPARDPQDYLLAQSENIAARGLDPADVVMGLSVHLPPSSETAPVQRIEGLPSAFLQPRRAEPATTQNWKRFIPIRSTPMRWAALFAMAMGLGALTLWHSNQASRAVLASAADAQWEGLESPVETGDHLPSGQLKLKSGVACVQLPNGVAMIVEGPARFEMTSPTNISLASGKLTATVPHAVQGFSVRTSLASIVDLGTVFGVDAQADQTRVEVFEGRVRAESVSTGSGAAQQRVLTSGQAAQVSAAGITVDPAGAGAQHFVRSLAPSTTQLDVVDLISGGDGTTRRRGVSIDSTGRRGVFPQAGYVKGDRLYHRITDDAVLDGCFIPDGRIGPVWIDSALHKFAFPATSDQSVGNICTGGLIPLPGNTSSALLSEYAGPEHSVLFMHVNRGLTLNLAAIHRLHPGAALAGFHCVAGNIVPSAPAHAKASLFVIVDGQARFQKVFSNLDGVFKVEAPLRADDRFLTLAITQSSDGIKDLGTMLADASLETTNTENPGSTAR